MNLYKVIGLYTFYKDIEIWGYFEFTPLAKGFWGKFRV